MTTNVYDIQGCLLTSDSRWSSEHGDLLIYVDDTGYDKIVFDEKLALLFAGDMRNIDHWKQWFFSDRTSPEPLDKLNAMSIIGVDVPSGELVFQSDYLLFSHTDSTMVACYGGTGAPYAQDCWHVNRCAVKAVESAKREDFYSGGTILSFDRSNNVSNVTNAAGFDDVFKQAKERGMIMNMKTKESMTLKEAANDGVNAEMKELAQKAVNGKVGFAAPFPGMSQPWTNEKKEELSRVLARYKRK